MKSLLKIVLVVFCLSSLGLSAQPQEQTKWPNGEDKTLDSGQNAVTSFYVDRRAKKWSLGIGVGPTFFYGDADKIQPSWHARLYTKWSISQVFGLKAEYNIGQLKGERDYQFPTLFKDNFKFKSRLQDFSLQMVFTLGNISFLRPLRKTQMYFVLGGGWASFHSVATFTDQRLYVGGDYYLDHYLGQGKANPNLGKDVTESYDGRHFIVPFGLGVKHNLGRFFDIGLEYRQTYLRNDNIDVYNTPIWANRWFDEYGLMNVFFAWKLGNKNAQHYDWLAPVESIYDKITEIDKRVDSLSSDSDGDGVSDYFDVDDSTEDDCMVYGNGTAVDTDGDGIPDCRDKEISMKDCGVDENGVMIDTDGDGVADCRDLEPNSPIGAYVDARGRTINTNCCNCEDVTLPSMYFDAGSCKIRPEYELALVSIIDKMKQCPDKKVVICGATGGKDKMYSGKTSDAASSCRTEAIINALVARGMSRDRITVDNTCKSDNPNKIDFKMIGGTSTRATTPGPRSAR